MGPYKVEQNPNDIGGIDYSVTGPTQAVGLSLRHDGHGEEMSGLLCEFANRAYAAGRASRDVAVSALEEIAVFGFGDCVCEGRCYCDKNHLQFIARCAIYKMNGWPKPVNHLAESTEGKESQ